MSEISLDFTYGTLVDKSNGPTVISSQVRIYNLNRPEDEPLVIVGHTDIVEMLEKCISEHDFLVAKCDSLDRHAKEWHELFLKKESEVDILQQQLHQVKETLRKHTELHLASEWHEDMGDCIWWRMPIEEPPHCGNPLDSEWTEDYYTHFTMLVEPIT